jgi:hypothetical protein
VALRRLRVAGGTLDLAVRARDGRVQVEVDRDGGAEVLVEGDGVAIVV